jgi:hypothetical protein
MVRRIRCVEVREGFNNYMIPLYNWINIYTSTGLRKDFYFNLFVVIMKASGSDPHCRFTCRRHGRQI